MSHWNSRGDIGCSLPTMTTSIGPLVPTMTNATSPITTYICGVITQGMTLDNRRRSSLK